MCGVTNLRIRNERMGTAKLGEMSMYDHVMRREEQYVGKEPPKREVQWRWTKGRPERRWSDRVADDIRENGLSGEEVYDGATWRRIQCRQTSTPHKSMK